MSATDTNSLPAEFRGYTPQEVATMTGLYGEHELRRMAAAGQVAHHRGARNKIVFFTDDIAALLDATRQPVKVVQAPAGVTPLTPDPFRSTARSSAAHRRTS